MSRSSACILLGLLTCIVACAGKEPQPKEPQPLVEHADRVTTLYSADDLLNAWSFSHDDVGMICVDGTVYNRNSQLMYDRYGERVLVAGVEGGTAATWLDLGDLRLKGTLQSVFHSLKREDSTIVIEGVDGDEPNRSYDLRLGQALATVAPQIGHVYLLRLDEAPEGSDPVYVALRVIDHAPDRYVTIRWRRLLAPGVRR